MSLESQKLKKKYKKAMVFGVFDGFHKGHEAFLCEALDHADKIVAVVTLPEMVIKLKQKTPKSSFEERIKTVSSFNKKIKAVPGDREIGSWSVLSEHNPDVVLLGYDQDGIAAELTRMNIPFIQLSAYKPEHYKSSLL